MMTKQQPPSVIILRWEHCELRAASPAELLRSQASKEEIVSLGEIMVKFVHRRFWDMNLQEMYKEDWDGSLLGLNSPIATLTYSSLPCVQPFQNHAPHTSSAHRSQLPHHSNWAACEPSANIQFVLACYKEVTCQLMPRSSILLQVAMTESCDLQYLSEQCACASGTFQAQRSFKPCAPMRSLAPDAFPAEGLLIA